MKKIFCTIVIASLFACAQRSQNKEISGFAEMPSFNLLLLDSATTFNTGNITTGKPTLLMYFSPDCEHCQELTKSLVRNIHSLKDIQIYMFTPMPLSELKQFYNYFNLSSYKNITVGKDYEYAFYKFYNATSFPCTAIYDKEKKLVKLYRGEITIDKIVAATHI